MQVNVVISGKLEVDEADLERLKRESISDLGAILQNRGKDLKKQVTEVYQKQEKPKEPAKKVKEEASPPEED